MITPGSANPLLFSADEGYNLSRSLRFRSSASAYLSKTYSATQTNAKIQTFSWWAKRGILGAVHDFFGAYDGTSATAFTVYFAANDTFNFDFGGASTNTLTTTQVFRDPSAWYHFVLAIDTTQATSSNRYKLYVNGTQVTAFSTANYVAQNADSPFGKNNGNNRIGTNWNNNSQFLDGYLTEVNFIDGQALTPSSFGQTDTLTGVWGPKRYAGTYGTNGFYLPFTDNSALTTSSNVGLGKDFSGNGNYWVTNNISITSGVTYDSMTDVPTLTSPTAANFAVLNPLANKSGTLAGANLNYSSANTFNNCSGTIGMSSGKWYWETTFNLTDSTQYGAMGVTLNPSGSFVSGSWPGLQSYEYACNQFNGSKDNNGVNTAYGSSLLTAGDIMMCAVDMDNGKIWWGKNGTWFASGDPAAGTNAGYTGLSGTAFPQVGNQTTSSNYNTDLSMNFGQRPFAYTPPTGYVALNTYNLPTPTIAAGNKYMDATLWTGDAVNPRNIVNAAGFKPDLVWLKSRSQAYAHRLADSVRGGGKELYSNSTSAETSADPNGSIYAFNSNGFQLYGSTDNTNVNTNGATLVAWQWQAGQGTTSSNTNGSVTSTVSVNASAGFSVVRFTPNVANGAAMTVGHGLGVTPSMIILKRTNSSDSWLVYHTSTGVNNYLSLNQTIASSAYAGWQGSLSSSLFMGLNAWQNGDTVIGYCFAPIAGYSAFGSYTGNGSSDGTFVYTGFRPKFLMIKVTNAVNAWIVVDSVRNTYNLLDKYLLANTSDAEGTAGVLDLVSNGFKMRNTYNGWNASGENIIYMAFAENPLKYSLAR